MAEYPSQLHLINKVAHTHTLLERRDGYVERMNEEYLEKGVGLLYNGKD